MLIDAHEKCNRSQIEEILAARHQHVVNNEIPLGLSQKIRSAEF